MKLLGKVLLLIVVAIVLLLSAAITLTVGWRPILGPRLRATDNRTFDRTPARVTHGRDVVNLAGCGTCHTPRNWKEHGAPALPGAEMAGQEFPLPGLPGRVVASNLTPDAETGAGRWTDDQIARSIREGIGHDGRTIFPIMPYINYHFLSDEDVASVVVYLRSLPAVHNSLPKTKINFPVNLLVRTVPEPITLAVPDVDRKNVIQRGHYLATIGCGCHNPTEHGQPLPGKEWAGGEVLEGPWGNVTSANITTDTSGISYYDEATFLKAVRTGYVGARKLNSIMPFGEFQYVPEDDLKAIYAYLRTVPAVKHRIDNSLPPTYCKFCRRNHGGGDQN
jgi:mono/diheme cytochrome c family protein